MNTPSLSLRHNRSRIARAMMLGVALFSLAACEDDDAPTSILQRVNLPRVVITPGAVTLRPGATQQFTAEVRDGSTDAPIAGSTVSWRSTDSLIARVSETGLVTVVRAGTAGITATYGAAVGTVAVTVLAPVTSLSLTAPLTSLPLGGSTQLVARPLDASGAVQSREVTYSSSATTVATVTSTGLVTAVAAGTTTITATSEGQTSTLSFTVVPPITIAFPSNNIVLGATRTQQLVPTLRDPVTGAIVTTGTVTYTTSNAAVATVSTTGLVTFLPNTPSTATISGAFGGGTSVVTVTNIATQGLSYTIGGILNSTVNYYVTVPAGSARLIVTLTNANAEDADIEVYSPAGSKVAESGNAASNETATVNSPVAGVYRIAVIGFTAYSNVTLRAVVQ